MAIRRTAGGNLVGVGIPEGRAAGVRLPERRRRAGGGVPVGRAAAGTAGGRAGWGWLAVGRSAVRGAGWRVAGIARGMAWAWRAARYGTCCWAVRASWWRCLCVTRFRVRLQVEGRFRWAAADHRWGHPVHEEVLDPVVARHSASPPLAGLSPKVRENIRGVEVQLSAVSLSNADWRSAGYSLVNSTHRPSAGWWKPRRRACSHWRVTPRRLASTGSAP
jgi:hypothetical protein